MPTFDYERRLDMPALPGRKFATVYLKQTRTQRLAVLKWLRERQAELDEFRRQTPEADWEFAKPLRQFGRTGGQPNYSLDQIVTDLVDQLAEGRDMPEAMLGRWNRLFDHDPDWQIHMQQSGAAQPQRYRPDLNALFEV